MASRNRGKRKSSIHDLSRTPPTDEERKAVREFLRDDESPVATAILGASVVEYELETELRAKFRRSDDETWKTLTGDIGPLGTFNQKIVAAYGFGIVNDVVKDGMDSVRRIRNQFAHAKRLFDFDHGLVVSELKSITLPDGTRSRLYKQLDSVRSLTEGPRRSYAKLCLVLSLQLVEKRVKRVTAREARRRARLRRKELVNALRRRRLGVQTSLLGPHGGFPSVDPRNTIAGGAVYESPHPPASDDGNSDN